MHPIPESVLSTIGSPQPDGGGVHARSRLMRRRFLVLLGLSVSQLAGCKEGGGYGDCDSGLSRSSNADGYYTLPSDASECPDSVALSKLKIKGYYGSYSADECEEGVSLKGHDGEICIYDVNCTYTCCGYGRPYLDEQGVAVAADTVPSDAWSEAIRTEVDELDQGEREQLAAFWLHNASAEHSSVAGFHRFALDLLAHGAPPELVRRAGEAAAQEITHAVDCFSLGSIYAGRRMGPAPLDLGTAAPVARDLAELAAWTVRDGAIGETLAAYLAAESLEHATDPEVRRALEVVVRDETAHADLAWQTLAWALDVGGEEVRAAVVGVFASLRAPVSPPEASTPGTRAHGLLPAELRDAAARRCIDEVIRPVMASLLGRALAA